MTPEAALRQRQHGKLKRARGKASDYKCIDCENKAQDWSQRHDTSGDNIDEYDPRCRSCHLIYDEPVVNRTRNLKRKNVKHTEETKMKMSSAALTAQANRIRDANGRYV